MSTSKVTPSYYGYVGLTNDALLIIQAVIEKQLEPIPRRPHERERTNLIKSGNVFVFIEEESGIKRWTDGIAWSPSRILGRFLVYRELDKNSLSEKDDKKKKKRKTSVEHDPLDLKLLMPPAQQLLQNQTQFAPDDFSKQLVGMMQLLYVFKDQGLIKKTLLLSLALKDELDSLNNGGVKPPATQKGDKLAESNKQTIHLISYYNADDVLNGKLQRPLVTDLKNISILSALWTAMKESSLGGKIPIEDEAYYFLDTNYQLQIMLQIQPSDRAGSGSMAAQGPGMLGQPNLVLPNGSVQQQSMGQQQVKYMQQQKFNLMHVLPNPYSVKEEEVAQQGLGQQQHMLPPPPPSELTFINPFNSQTQSNNYASYYNNYLYPPPPQQAPQSVQGAQTPQTAQISQQPPQVQQNVPAALYLDNAAQFQHYPPFPQHFQQVYGPLHQQHGLVLNLSEYLGGSLLLMSSNVVDGTALANNGSSILLMSGNVPSTLGKKFNRSSFSHSHGNWFTTSSANGVGPGNYVAQAPPPHHQHLQNLGGIADLGLHHHHEDNATQIQRNTFSGTT